MVKIIVYKDYDLIEELEKIWLVSTRDGGTKDEMIKELQRVLIEAAEITLNDRD